MRLVCTIALLLSYYSIAFSQTDSVNTLVIDSTRSQSIESDSSSTAQKKHSPFLASILSTVTPGLGQVYNKKYWKVPIIYAGLGVGFYFANKSRKKYIMYRDAYVSRFNEQEDLLPEYNPQALDDLQQTERDKMERFFIITGLFYILNIIDASVDAHLFHFDVSDDLSFDISPGQPTLDLSSKSMQAQDFSFMTLKISF